MSVLHAVICCLTIYNVSEGRIVQGIIGRNLSVAWTFNNVGQDAIRIIHDTSLFLRVWPFNNYSDLREQPDRVRVAVDKIANGTVTLTVTFLNITKKDAGMYKVTRQWKSEEFNDSVLLETIDETTIPKIVIVPQINLDSTLVLECRLSNRSIGKFSWRVNGSLIEKHGRYSQNDTFLSIKNVTADDQYSLYKCKESGSGLESDPYNVNISGPSTITFAPNITMVPEHSVISASCLADCYSICTWNWSKLDPTSGRDKVISKEGTLHIHNITRQDAGTYLCRVLNKLTGISLENLISLEIVYGPDAVLFNISDKIIQLDENESVTISCSAACYPPCQIGWTGNNAENVTPIAVMKLVNVKRDGNYTCHAMNPRNDNTTISDTVYVILKSEGASTKSEWTAIVTILFLLGTLLYLHQTNHYTTTYLNQKEDTGEQSYYITTTLNPKTDTEGINRYTTAAMNPEAEDFPSKRHLLYIVLGMGAILTVAFLACLLHQIRICLHVNRASNSNTWTDSNIDDGDENVQEENLPENYWTIVSNERGEMSTAIETIFDRSREPPLIGPIVVPTDNESEQSIRSDDVKLNEELDGYLNPIHSSSVEFNEYIHPVHTDNDNTDFVSTNQSTEF